MTHSSDRLTGFGLLDLNRLLQSINCRLFCSRYELKDMSKINLINLYLLTAMGPPGGGRNDVTPRFMRHFHAVSMVPFNDPTLIRIFSALMMTYMRVRF